MDNKTILSTLVENHNLSSPNKTELMELEGYDLATALKFALNFKIQFLENNYSEKENLVVNFINCVVSVSRHCILPTPFSFDRDIRNYQTMPDYYRVGMWGEDPVLVDKKTDEVIVYNDDAENISFFLAPSFKDFLAIIPILAEDGRLSFLNLLDKKDKLWKEKIRAIVPDEKYFSIYNTTFL